MKMVGMKSICCGHGTMMLSPSKRKGDKIYLCKKCNQPCEAYFIVEIERRENEIRG